MPIRERHILIQDQIAHIKKLMKRVDQQIEDNNNATIHLQLRNEYDILQEVLWMLEKVEKYSNTIQQQDGLTFVSVHFQYHIRE